MRCFYFLSTRLNPSLLSFFFFFNDTATTEIYTLSLHDALPISRSGTPRSRCCARPPTQAPGAPSACAAVARIARRSEEHTSELQSRPHLVCRLLLEKKKKKASRAHYRAYSDEQTASACRSSVSR